MIHEELLVKILDETINKYVTLCNSGEIKLDIDTDYNSLSFWKQGSYRYITLKFPIPAASVQNFETIGYTSTFINSLLSLDKKRYNKNIVQFMCDIGLIKNDAYINYNPYLNFELYKNMSIEGLQINEISTYRDAIKKSLRKLLFKHVRSFLYVRKPPDVMGLFEHIMSKWVEHLKLNKSPIFNYSMLYTRDVIQIILSKFFYASDFMESLYFDVIQNVINIADFDDIKKDAFNKRALFILYKNNEVNSINEAIDELIENIKLVDVVMNAVITNILMTMIGTMQLCKFDDLYNPKLIIDNIAADKDGYRLTKKDVYIKMIKKSNRQTNIKFILDTNIDPRPDAKCVTCSSNDYNERTFIGLLKYTPLEILIEFITFAKNHIDKLLSNRSDSNKESFNFEENTLEFMSTLFDVILNIAKFLTKYNSEILKYNVESISIRNEHLYRKSNKRITNENRALIFAFTHTVANLSYPSRINIIGKCKSTDVSFVIKFKNNLRPIRIKSKVNYGNKILINNVIYPENPAIYDSVLSSNTITANVASNKDFIDWLNNNILNRDPLMKTLQELSEKNEKINDMFIKLHLLLERTR